jgi:protein involved in polysaccharide export with SLBB domain
MEMFRNMTPEQQRAILETLGSGTGSSSAGGILGGAGRVTSDRPLQFPQTVTPRRNAGPRDDEEDGRDSSIPREPRFKPQDTLLLSLEIRKYERQSKEFNDDSTDRQSQLQQPAIPGRQQLNQQLPPQQRTDGKAPEEPKEVQRDDQDQKRLEDLRERVLRRNPYKLDKWGILNVAELGPIPLAGLTVEEATERLAAETRLEDFVVRVTRLPLKPIGTEALKPFGYDLFSGITSTFAPATDVPVPSEYVVGPGDTIEVQLIGNGKGGRYALVVGRDGRINFPDLGPIAVSGLRFDDVRSAIEARVREQMIGTQVNVGIGQLRSIRIFVLGEAETPGSYTVSGLSTITNALFVSGGVKKIGSLRNIELKRNGATVTRLDLYDLLLKGDTRADARLLPGDVIFIPPVGPTVSLAGEVRRPAIYELKNETTTRELVALAGGLTPQADPKLATLERVSDQQQRVTMTASLAPSAEASPVRSGDVLRVPAIRPVLEDSVSLNGYVYRPGEFQYRRGMRIADILPSVDELQPNADQHYLLIRRELPPDRKITVFSADLSQAISQPNSAANFELAPRDRIYVFDMESGRDRIVEPLMRELRMQSGIDEPTREVSIAGKAKVPGKYPFEPGMRVSDLLRAGGTPDEAAYGGEAELTRYDVVNGESRQAKLIQIDLRKVLAGDPTANIALQPFDYLVIKELPLWAKQEEVEVSGEVKFPGRYPIHRGETLRSVMERAGGVTDLAFVPGSVFTRKELKEREHKQIESLANRMQSDVAMFSLQTAQETGKDASQALTVGQALLTNLRDAKPVGRLVINLNESVAAKPGSEQDVILKDGDSLFVPRVTQEVTVIGEVQSTTSHLYDASLGRDDYIQKSGGLTPRADKSRIYIVRADGSVVTNEGNSWFSSGAGIQPGDTIVAPLDTERMRPLPFWTAVTTIIYNLSIAAAAVNSF